MPTMSVIEGPLEPSAPPSTVTDPPEDPSFVNFFSVSALPLSFWSSSFFFTFLLLLFFGENVFSFNFLDSIFYLYIMEWNLCYCKPFLIQPCLYIVEIKHFCEAGTNSYLWLNG